MSTYLTPKQQNLFEQHLLEDSDGLCIRIINARSGRSRLTHLQCVLSSSFYAASNKRSTERWIHRLFRVPHENTDIALLHQFSMQTGIRQTNSMMSDIPWLSSSSEMSESDEKQLVVDHSVYELKSKHNDDRCVFPASMRFPQYMTRDYVDKSRRDDYYDRNPFLFVWVVRKNQISGQMALHDIIYIQKGKTTPGAKSSRRPSSHILSVIAKSTSSLTRNETLDIEAPTESDRDKFALAFATFCRVPIEDDPLHII